jgi:uncharacterized protein (TIGR01244 family)
MFKSLTDAMLVSPQIGLADVAAAQAQGVTLIINNRPEGEAEDQITGAEIEAAALAAGMAYVAIPVTPGSFTQPQVDAMAQALDTAVGPVLAYCRTGTRSTLLWSLAEAKDGADPEKLTDIAATAGYDVSPVRPLMDMLKSQA